MLPILNKMDLPQAEPERVQNEIEEIIGIEASEAVPVSAKTGMGEDALEYLVEHIPAPEGDREKPLQALIIDSWFDNYLGVVSLVRVKQGMLRSVTSSWSSRLGSCIRQTWSAYSRLGAR